jgi:hypothetical protein
MAEGQVGMGVYLVEGVVEQDPMSDRFVIRTSTADGKPFTFDPQAVLGQLKGQEVRVVIAPLASVQQIEELVRQQGETSVIEVVDPPGTRKNGS